MTRPSHFGVNKTELPSRLKISVSMNIWVLEFYGYMSGYFFMIFFQSKLGWSLAELLGRSTDSGCRGPLQKQETKRIDGSSLVASPMPKSVLSGGREDRLLREWIFVRTFHRWGGLVL